MASDRSDPERERTLRLFVGTTVPQGVADRVFDVASAIVALPGWRPARQEQWHVTALFIGACPVSELEPVRALFEQVARSTRAITLGDGRLVVMPDERPSMLWLRFDPSNALTHLHHELARTMHVPPSSFDPYWPHVTLARAQRQVDPMDPGPVIIPHMTLDTLTLFKSEPGSSGTIHAPLATVALSLE